MQKFSCYSFILSAIILPIQDLEVILIEKLHISIYYIWQILPILGMFPMKELW